MRSLSGRIPTHHARRCRGTTSSAAGAAAAPLAPSPGVGRRCHAGRVELRFSGEVIWWRGPAPHHFVVLPDPEAGRLRAVASRVTYGWGCIPATVTLGGTTFTTSIFPKDGGFRVPLKVAARRAEGVELGDDVDLLVVVPEPDGPPDEPDDESAATPPPSPSQRPLHDPADDDDYYDPARTPPR